MALTANDERQLNRGVRIATVVDFNNYTKGKGYILITDRSRDYDVWHKTKCLRSAQWQADFNKKVINGGGATGNYFYYSTIDSLRKDTRRFPSVSGCACP